VQPTRFEGAPGGGAVYDAAAIGQRCVVSDIPVNRELSLPGLRTFAAGDADALATAMSEVIAEPAPPRPPPATLEAQGRERRIACGRVLLQALSHARQP
jgi:glycosyltransferase involved in cell wall biosynthesis